MTTETRYPMQIQWGEQDAAFVVHVPDLPGCFADGATREDAVRNAEQVIQEWLGQARRLRRPIPAPSTRLTTPS